MITESTFAPLGANSHVMARSLTVCSQLSGVSAVVTPDVHTCAGLKHAGLLTSLTRLLLSSCSFTASPTVK